MKYVSILYVICVGFLTFENVIKTWKFLHLKVYKKVDAPTNEERIINIYVSREL